MNRNWFKFAFFVTIAIIATAFLLGCDDSKVGADGYRFGKPTRELKHFTVDVDVYPTQGAMRDAAGERSPVTGKPYIRDAKTRAELQAWGTITSVGCHIRIVDPRVVYAPQWPGHELHHCIYGQFHGDPG